MIQHKRQAERELEAQRRVAFSKNYPRLAEIPLIGNLVCFIAGEGWGILIAIFALLLLGVALRLWNLDVLVPCRSRVPPPQCRQIVAGWRAVEPDRLPPQPLQ